LLTPCVCPAAAGEAAGHTAEKEQAEGAAGAESSTVITSAGPEAPKLDLTGAALYIGAAAVLSLLCASSCALVSFRTLAAEGRGRASHDIKSTHTVYTTRRAGDV